MERHLFDFAIIAKQYSTKLAVFLPFFDYQYVIRVHSNVKYFEFLYQEFSISATFTQTSEFSVLNAAQIQNYHSFC